MERSSTDEGPAAPAVDEAPPPGADGQLVIAVRRAPAGLDPLTELDPWGRRIADDLVFEGLVRRSPAAAPWVEMALADRCEQPSGRVVECHLRPGVRFHDGTELTLEDVEYSLAYWLDPRRTWTRQRHGLATMRLVERIDAPASGTGRDPGRWVRIGFAEQEPLALELLAAVKIVPRKKHRSRDGRFAREPVGTGPMRVVAVEPDRLVLARTEPWTRSDRGPAELSGLVLRAVDDGAEALTLLRRGQVHVVPDLAPHHVPLELQRPGMAARFRAWLRSPARYDVLLWNVGQGLTRNPLLRHALHAAVPRAALARDVHGGSAGLPAEAPVDLHDPTPIDLEALALAVDTLDDPAAHGLPARPSPFADATGVVAAWSVLDALGWPRERDIRRKLGDELRVTLTWDGASGPGSTTAREIRASWATLGVVSPHATAPWGYVLRLIKEGQFQVALVQLAEHDDADLFHHYHRRGALNVTGTADAELDRALEAFRAAQVREERQGAKARVARRLAALRATTVLHAPASVLLASRRVEGLSFIDDLPVLDRLGLAAPAGGGGW